MATTMAMDTKTASTPRDTNTRRTERSLLIPQQEKEATSTKAGLVRSSTLLRVTVVILYKRCKVQGCRGCMLPRVTSGCTKYETETFERDVVFSIFSNRELSWSRWLRRRSSKAEITSLTLIESIFIVGVKHWRRSRSHTR
ncbi:hypothetical protein SeMB42_g07391 [Synchytrium endobioticum]|uniref:Uncharacterized protein n=1 Tax=Synchytrium endobioticum TaxID=286115 RepID=A0A507C8V6_9FUNG|nr:hypothetical protein SeMB42_g07391 [Synchytrium endobioticum]